MIPKYKLSREWQLGCIKTERISFLPHKDLETDERERLIVTYPFANLILQGHFDSHPVLSVFNKQRTMIFCNFKPAYPRRYPSLDLIAFSHLGDILILESKKRNKSDGKGNYAVKKLSSAAEQLSNYAKEFVALSSRFRGDVYKSWSNAYYHLYSKIHEFPSLYKTMNLCFSMDQLEQQQKFIETINQSISENKVHYGLAFNESRDHDDKLNIDVPGYGDIDSNIIIDMAKSGWDLKNGKLMLFAVNHKNYKVSSLL